MTLLRSNTQTLTKCGVITLFQHMPLFRHQRVMYPLQLNCPFFFTNIIMPNGSYKIWMRQACRIWKKWDIALTCKGLIWEKCTLSTPFPPLVAVDSVKWSFFYYFYHFYSPKKQARVGTTRGLSLAYQLLLTYSISPTPWTLPWRPMGPGARTQSDY